MFYSKSLFVEFMTSPKLAWWHVNDKTIYQEINEASYGSMDGAVIGQVVEDQVKLYYHGKTFAEVDTSKIDFRNWHCSYHGLTMDVVKTGPEVIYQGGFVYKNLFCKVDFLVKNEEGKYDIVEVKSKNSIRKKMKAEPLLEDLQADVSFQHYVVQQALGDAYSGKVYLMYLNKEYVKNGDITPQELLKQEEVTKECFGAEIEGYLTTMKDKLSLSESEFNQAFPYDGGEYLEYYGKVAPESSIWYIPGIAKKKLPLMEKGHTKIMDVDEEDMGILCKKDGSPSRSSDYVQYYQQAETVIDKDGIQQELESLAYPLFFYDYETIPSPIPVLDGTSPWQQATVQYSVHKVTKDGTITHKEFLLSADAKDNQALVEHLAEDLEGGEGTYIVWNEGFEKKRNEELAIRYPQYAGILEKINANTYDLMLIFKHFLYFDRRFKGSASIKKVLPVLTDISYDDLAVSNGSIASDHLLKLQKNEIPKHEIAQLTKDLLAYCEQDTWAMVRIWEELRKVVE